MDKTREELIQRLRNKTNYIDIEVNREAPGLTVQIDLDRAEMALVEWMGTCEDMTQSLMMNNAAMSRYFLAHLEEATNFVIMRIATEPVTREKRPGVLCVSDFDARARMSILKHAKEGVGGGQADPIANTFQDEGGVGGPGAGMQGVCVTPERLSKPSDVDNTEDEVRPDSDASHE